MSKIKEMKKQILRELFEACNGGKKAFEYAQDYLAEAKRWKYMMDYRSSYGVKQAKAQLIKYKNMRDRLMPLCKAAVEVVDKYFPIELAPVAAQTDTGLQRLAGAQLEDIKDEK